MPLGLEAFNQWQSTPRGGKAQTFAAQASPRSAHTIGSTCPAGNGMLAKTAVLC
jgi:hypothetical protein